MQKLNIDVSKIPREKIRAAGKGKYLDLVLFENRNGQDERGNDGFVALDVTKEEREAGTRGEIIGNWKHIGQKPTGGQRSPAPAQRPKTFAKPPVDPDLDGDPENSIPF